VAEQLTLVLDRDTHAGSEGEGGQLTLRLDDPASTETDRINASFQALVSHQLRTPLAVVMGALHTLSKHGRTMPEEVFDRMVARALEQGSDLHRLIESLLEGLALGRPGD
jgi:K+-sensing histidine kinase KdpD